MKLYISGISGTGMGPLALMAKNAGFEVFGSDLNAGAILPELEANGIEVKIGQQDGEFLKEKMKNGIDWFVYTSALSTDHPELLVAKEAGLKISKRDELTVFLIEKLNLKMVAVSGTHGKTTTTSMIIFTARKLGLPISYIVGTTLEFAPSGFYDTNSKFFIYEADEYDRNFLKFSPWLSILPSVSYDHPDIYPTKENYLAAFEQFKSQSEQVVDGCIIDDDITLSGESRRLDATFAKIAIQKMAPKIPEEKIIEALNEFPGAGRRFEKISDGVYTDYAHHPEEIVETIKAAKEEAKKCNKDGIVVIYQPHQNTRQHEVHSLYKDAFIGVDKVFWLPTYLTRENPDLKILTPEDLISELLNPDVAEPAEISDDLATKIKSYRDNNFLVILMTAGPADAWFRTLFN